MSNIMESINENNQEWARFGVIGERERLEVFTRVRENNGWSAEQILESLKNEFSERGEGEYTQEGDIIEPPK